MTNTTLTKTIILAAPPARVWAYLTEPDLLAKWFHAPKAPLKAGQKLEMFGADSGDLMIWGDVRTARAPELLEYTFCIGPMGDAVSTVTWTLEPIEAGTKLTLKHAGMPEGAEAFGLLAAIEKGWDGHLGTMRTDING